MDNNVYFLIEIYINFKVSRLGYNRNKSITNSLSRSYIHTSHQLCQYRFPIIMIWYSSRISRPRDEILIMRWSVWVQRAMSNRLIEIAYALCRRSFNRNAYASNCEINGVIRVHNWWLIICMTQLTANPVEATSLFIVPLSGAASFRHWIFHTFVSALKVTNGSYIMNGEFAVSAPGTYEAAGARFVYSRAAGLDTVFALGPIHQPIDIMVS